MNDELILSTDKLTRKYGEQTVVSNVSLSIKKGRIYGLLGRNGAGKTTIMKMILGLTEKTSGEITAFHKPLHSGDKNSYARMGSMIETPGFYSYLTGRENLITFAKLRGKVNHAAVQEAMSVVGLPYRDSKTFSSYSLGMKQRLGIANAIMHNPELLILDEPTNGLDPIGIAEIRDFMKRLCKEEGKTILISSHILPEMALMADDIGIVQTGCLLEETSMTELAEKTKKYVEVTVNSIPDAVSLLENKMYCRDYAVKDGQRIEIYENGVDTATLNQIMVTNGVGVSSICLRYEGLEEHFKKLTGGVGIE